MEYDQMTVTMEDGFKVVFFKKNTDVKLIMLSNGRIHENKVQAGSIHAVVGEPLTFTYLYGYGSSETAKAKTPVKEIEYE